MYKKLSECKEKADIINRLDILRKNMVKYSKENFKSSDDKAIYVDWNWINYFEVRLEENNIRIEIWVADVKHQWNDLAKVSSMKFVSEQKSTSYIKKLELEAQNYIGAYIKLGDTYGNTLKVSDFDLNYVKSNFNKKYYKDFYNVLGGQWKKDLETSDYTRNGKYLVKEIRNLPLVNNNDIISYITNETRNIINLSLGTTINVTIPIKELAKRDVNFNNDNDELAEILYQYIMEYKEKIEDELN